MGIIKHTLNLNAFGGKNWPSLEEYSYVGSAHSDKLCAGIDQKPFIVCVRPCQLNHGLIDMPDWYSKLI